MSKAKLQQMRAGIQPYLPALRKEYHIKKLGVFGSVARGQEKKNSDVDIIVEFVSPIGFFEFVQLEKKLQKIFKKRVDLVSKKALKPTIKKQALKETIYL